MIIDSTKIPAQIGGTVLKLLCELRDAETRGERPTMTQLARCVGVTTAAMTGTQDSAVAAGWVTSGHSAADRRKKWMELTREGLALVESMRVKDHTKPQRHEGERSAAA